MAKKRSVPHGRTVARGNKTNSRTFTPATPNTPKDAPIELEASQQRPSSMPTANTSFSSVVRSTPRFSRTGNLGIITDYRYVVSDLKRIAILACATAAVLIGLTFMIR